MKYPHRALCALQPSMTLNLQKAGVGFTFSYDPSGADTPKIFVNPLSQLEQAVWEAILDGPLKDRSFYADPAPDLVSRLEHRVWRIPIRFSHNGDPIPGLELPQGMRTVNWGFFIPMDTPEWRSVKAAIALHHVLDQENRRTYGTRREKLIEEKRKVLQQAIAEATGT